METVSNEECKLEDKNKADREDEQEKNKEELRQVDFEKNSEEGEKCTITAPCRVQKQKRFSDNWETAALSEKKGKVGEMADMKQASVANNNQNVRTLPRTCSK